MAPSDSGFALIGAGNMAQALGRVLHTRGGLRVVAVANRTRQRAEEAAAFIAPDVPVVEMAEVARRTPRVLIAVTDRALPSVAAALANEMKGVKHAIALHTCGAVGPDALAPLREAGVPCGVLHPLQTITSPEQGAKALLGVTYGVAGDPPAVDWARTLAGRLEGQVLLVDVERLSAYHAGAVMASNAIVGVIDAAIALMVQAGINPREAMYALGPLAFTSLENALTAGPVEALTGPVVRGDRSTIAEHLEVVRQMPSSLEGLYVSMTRYLLEIAKERGLPAAGVQAIEDAIGDDPLRAGAASATTKTTSRG